MQDTCFLCILVLVCLSVYAGMLVYQCACVLTSQCSSLSLSLSLSLSPSLPPSVSLSLALSPSLLPHMCAFAQSPGGVHDENQTWVWKGKTGGPWLFLDTGTGAWPCDPME